MARSDDDSAVVPMSGRYFLLLTNWAGRGDAVRGLPSALLVMGDGAIR